MLIGEIDPFCNIPPSSQRVSLHQGVGVAVSQVNFRHTVVSNGHKYRPCICHVLVCVFLHR